MSRPGLYALVAVALAVLVLIGSLVAGVREGDRDPRVVGGAGIDDLSDDRVRVEVLNAAGITGLARSATERLRSAGYDVVYYGNAPAFGRDTSVVLDRLGKPDAARSVADAVGIPLVREAMDTTLYLDVTVIVGTDWEGIPAPDTLAVRDSV